MTYSALGHVGRSSFTLAKSHSTFSCFPFLKIWSCSPIEAWDLWPFLSTVFPLINFELYSNKTLAEQLITIGHSETAVMSSSCSFGQILKRRFHSSSYMPGILFSPSAKVLNSLKYSLLTLWKGLNSRTDFSHQKLHLQASGSLSAAMTKAGFGSQPSWALACLASPLKPTLISSNRASFLI